MHKGRLEAFSDGVLAILITIMVLEFATPHGSELSALRPLVPTFCCYLLSFVFLGIYWNNHHHMLQAAHRVNGAVLWANMHLLFWLSLVPFGTAWMGHHSNSAWPVAVYGIVLFFAGVAYFILARVLISLHGRESVLAKALGADVKGQLSVLLYFVAIGMAFVVPLVSKLLYVCVAILWLVPDRRFERHLAEK